MNFSDGGVSPMCRKFQIASFASIHPPGRPTRGSGVGAFTLRRGATAISGVPPPVGDETVADGVQADAKAATMGSSAFDKFFIRTLFGGKEVNRCHRRGESRRASVTCARFPRSGQLRHRPRIDK